MQNTEMHKFSSNIHANKIKLKIHAFKTLRRFLKGGKYLVRIEFTTVASLCDSHQMILK